MAYKRVEDFESILDWHKETFPDANLDTQLRKLAEEDNELYHADEGSEEYKEEYADVYISIVGLSRFNKDLADNEFYNLGFNGCLDLDEAYEAIDKKMAINRQRKWQKSEDGIYQSY